MNEFDIRPQGETNFSSPFAADKMSEQQEVEARVTYNDIVNVPFNFAEKPDTMKLHNLLEMDADNTIVVVGDEVVYYGGPLHYEDVPNLKVRATNKYFNRSEPIAVKALMEGERVVVYATDYEKASLYINQFKKAAA